MASTDKELSAPDINQLLRRSVVEPDETLGQNGGATWNEGIMWMVSQNTSGIVPWGVNPTIRDKQLRAFLPTESILNSAIGSVVVRNAGFEWAVKGSSRLAELSHDMLINANMGRGWYDFASRLSNAFYTSDKGAFVEIIRASRNPSAPVLGIQTLDPVRCWRTDDPERPVIYQDIKGRFHAMMWYEVVHLLEMPSTYERLQHIQYSAVTRILNAVQTWKDEQTYLDEKVSGRHTKAIHVVSGVQPSTLETAVKSAQAQADANGQTRYIQPVVVATSKADAKADVATLELTGLPDGWDQEKQFKLYMTIVSMGLFTDFQEFAPLPGGNLGTSMQSEILHLKSRGKGPQAWRKLLEHMFNHTGILPEGAEFTFDEQDYEADSADAGLLSTYAEALTKLVTAGVMDGQAGRQFLLDKGYMDEETFARLDGYGRGDLTDPGAIDQPDTPRRTQAHEATVEEEDADSTGAREVAPERIALEEAYEVALEGPLAETLDRIWKAAQA